MFCIKCGNKIDNDAKFCPQCGASTEEKNASSVPSITLRKFSNTSKVHILNIATICCLALEIILVFTPLINLEISDMSHFGNKVVFNYYQAICFNLTEILKNEILAAGIWLLTEILFAFMITVGNIYNYKKTKSREYEKRYRGNITACNVLIFLIYVTGLVMSMGMRGDFLTFGETSGWLNVSLSPTMYILLITELALMVIRRIGEAYNEVNAAE